MDMSLSKLWEIMKEAWHAAVLGLQRVRHNLANEQQQQQQQCTSQSNIFNFDEVQFMIFFLFIDYDFGV